MQKLAEKLIEAMKQCKYVTKNGVNKKQYKLKAR